MSCALINAVACRRLTLALILGFVLSVPHATTAAEVDGSVYVVADSHGAAEEMARTLQRVQLIDGERRWIGARARLYVLGDMLDRGPASPQLLDDFIRLQDEASAAGGQVEVLLGNHEVMNLLGDLRYLSAEEKAAYAKHETPALREQGYQRHLAALALTDDAGNRAAFDTRYWPGFFAHQQMFAPDGRYGSWLLQRPVLAKAGDSLLVHGGLSELINAEQALAELNSQWRSELQEFVELWHGFIAAGRLLPDADLLQRPLAVRPLPPGPRGKPVADPALQRFTELQTLTLMQPDGPLWYRGNVYCHPYIETEVLERWLDAHQAKRLIVGHTPTETRQIESRLDGRLLQADTGMLTSYYGGRGNIIELRGDTVRVWPADGGDSYEPVPAPQLPPLYPAGLDAAAVAKLLAAAPISKDEALPVGVTKPRRLTLEAGEIRVRAVLKQFDSDPNLQRDLQSSRLQADRFLYELPAFWLSERLGLGLVPVAALREYDGRNGLLQYWVENASTEAERIRSKAPFHGYCARNKQLNLMDVFDQLIQNTDRNLGNILTDNDTGQFWLIDHSRAFGRETRPRDTLKGLKTRLTPELRAALAGLNEEELQRELSAWLNRKQILAILKRRDKLLAQP